MNRAPNEQHSLEEMTTSETALGTALRVSQAVLHGRRPNANEPPVYAAIV